MTKQELDDKIEELIEDSKIDVFRNNYYINDDVLKVYIIDLIKSLSFTDLTKIREMI